MSTGPWTVVACEWHGSLAAAARRNVAANALSRRVSVVHADVAKLARGKRGQGPAHCTYD
jgi:tRNA1(Val) A37 N6-methylase TrmN6